MDKKLEVKLIEEMAIEMNKGELIVKGRCDGLGNPAREGSYVSLVYSNDLADYRLTISEGAAAVLIDELRGALASKQPA